LGTDKLTGFHAALSNGGVGSNIQAILVEDDGLLGAKMLKVGSTLVITLLGNLVAFGAVLSPTVVFGESRLAPCPINEMVSWTNCQGTYTYPDGRKYVGEWRDGHFNGRGTFTYPHGEKFIGEFRDNKINGQGTYTHPDGRKYVGEWRDGDFHGQGTLTYLDGGEYVGEFRDGKPNGQGTHRYSDGRKYVGEWRDGHFNGQGIFTYPDGRQEVGEFRDNKYFRESSTDKLSNAPSEVSRITEDNLPLLLPMVLLAVGGAITAGFVMKAKPQTSVARSIPTSTVVAGAYGQSRLEDARRVLRETAVDFSVPDDKLLELRESARRVAGELKELDRKAAKKGLFGFLRFR
jgi:hypothetical protein